MQLCAVRAWPGRARAGFGQLRLVRVEQGAGSCWAMAWCEGVRGLTHKRARRRAREACLGSLGLADNWARPRWVDSGLGWQEELGRHRIGKGKREEREGKERKERKRKRKKEEREGGSSLKT